MSPWLLAALVIVPAGLLYSYLVHRRTLTHIQKRLAGSPEISPEGFASAHFPPEQALVAQRVHRVFLETAQVAVRRAGPDDRLVEDLRLDDLDSMATVEFVLALEKEFGLKLSEAEMAKAKTLREIIIILSERLDSSPGK